MGDVADAAEPVTLKLAVVDGAGGYKTNGAQSSSFW
jgi:hypothetical protein